MRVLVTCPPMLGAKSHFVPILESKGFEVVCPNVTQTLTEDELITLVPTVDGWIIGDDPATKRVFEAGVKGKLKAAVKWGIGVDNVDIEACKELCIPVTNIPNMFGSEVADLAISYVIALARDTFFIDREIRKGNWPKNRGISLSGKVAGVVGYGDIGRNTARRLRALGLNVIVYDPYFSGSLEDSITSCEWPNSVDRCDFLVFTCSLNQSNYHMFNRDVMSQCKNGLRVVNVARGPLIDEVALCDSLRDGEIYAAALDVFENEPLPLNSYLREHDYCILGSHNASNTFEAVIKTNEKAIEYLVGYLSEK